MSAQSFKIASLVPHLMQYFYQYLDELLLSKDSHSVGSLQIGGTKNNPGIQIKFTFKGECDTTCLMDKRTDNTLIEILINSKLAVYFCNTTM